MRSRCKDARKNISQKAARKEKGASAKSAYHGHDCFGLKSTTFFCRFFFHRRRYYYFQSLRLYQGCAYVQRASVVCSLSSLIAYRKGATTIARRSSRTRREKICMYAVVYIGTSRSPSPPECKAMDVLRARAHFLPSPSEASPETFFSILSRGYRVTGLLKWPEHCSASRVARTRVPAVIGAYTVRFRHVANEKNRATENEKRIDFRARAVLSSCGTLRVLARVERILIRTAPIFVIFFSLIILNRKQ